MARFLMKYTIEPLMSNKHNTIPCPEWYRKCSSTQACNHVVIHKVHYLERSVMMISRYLDLMFFCLYISSCPQTEKEWAFLHVFSQELSCFDMFAFLTSLLDHNNQQKEKSKNMSHNTEARHCDAHKFKMKKHNSNQPPKTKDYGLNLKNPSCEAIYYRCSTVPIWIISAHSA